MKHWMSALGMVVVGALVWGGNASAGSCTYYQEAFLGESNRGNATNFLEDSGMSYREWREIFQGKTTEESLMILQSVSLGAASANSVGSQDVAPAAASDWRGFWGLSTTYRKDDFDVAAGGPFAAKTRTRSQTLSLSAVRDRFALLTALTYDRIDPDSNFGDTAYDRMSLRLTPVYGLLEQAADGFDLDVIGSLGLSHSWYEDGMGTNDPSHVYTAAGLGVGRIFSFGSVRLSYLYGVSRNISGDNEVTGKSTIGAHSAGITYTVPLADRWLLSTGLDWVHTSDLPSIYDSDEYTGLARVSYFGERWGVSVGIRRSINNGNQRAWSATGEIVRRW